MQPLIRTIENSFFLQLKSYNKLVEFCDWLDQNGMQKMANFLDDIIAQGQIDDDGVKSLLKLADLLDKSGRKELADEIDKIIKTY